jgi:hypothetical protein
MLTVEQAKELVGRDPHFVKPEKPTAFDRWALGLINDERDLPFVKLVCSSTLVLVPWAAGLFYLQSPWAPEGLRVAFWPLAVAYLLVNAFGFLDRYILMLHNTSHRVLFKRELGWLNHYIPWVLGPFFGETPETYVAHHMGMHHPENNLKNDLSSTMRYERDSAADFVVYWARFFFAAIVEMAFYFARKGRYRTMRKMLTGELLWYSSVFALGYFVSWQATLVVLVVPFCAVRFLMMAGNWGQHAFIDASDPASPFKNSITCIDVRYNRRAFNDGYHIGHHVKANRHWTELPADFYENVATYAREGAIVFRGIDFFQVWLLLVTRSYKTLAKHYVELDGKGRTQDEIIALLRSRTRPIRDDAPVGVPA